MVKLEFYVQGYPYLEEVIQRSINFLFFDGRRNSSKSSGMLEEGAKICGESKVCWDKENSSSDSFRIRNLSILVF